jgi:hypothetical protein
MTPTAGQTAHALELEKLRVLADFNARRHAARSEMLALIAKAAK